MKCPCPLPPLRSSNSSRPKHRGLVEKKDPEEKKLKPLPKMSLKNAESQHKNTSNGVLPPDLPGLVSTQTFTLYLPMSVHKSIHTPVTDQSHSVLLWKRRAELSKVHSRKSSCTAEKVFFAPAVTSPSSLKNIQLEAYSPKN